jgi:hypothetical protein
VYSDNNAGLDDSPPGITTTNEAGPQSDEITLCVVHPVNPVCLFEARFISIKWPAGQAQF